jgi:hypothetical protein
MDIEAWEDRVMSFDVNDHKRAGGSFNSKDARPAAVPAVGGGTGNQSPEPSGTYGTSILQFEPLAAYLDRTSKLPPARWLIDGVVPESGRLLVVAAPNAGKTWLALVIAKTAAAAGRKVIVILEEGSPGPMGHRFKDLAFQADLPVEVCHNQGFLLNNSSQRVQIIEKLKSEDAPVLILDPLVSLFLGDENDTQEMNLARAHLEELARANSKALIVLLHHTSKSGERGEGSPVHAGRGSGVLAGWADVQLNLTHEQTPKGEGRVGFVARVTKCRDGERDHRVRFIITLGEGTVACDPVEDSGSTETPQLIRDALTSSASPVSGTELARIVRRRKDQVLRAVKDMEAEGELRRTSTGYVLAEAKKGSPSELCAQTETGELAP